MMLSLRRNRRDYALPIRSKGKSIFDRFKSKKIRQSMRSCLQHLETADLNDDEDDSDYQRNRYNSLNLCYRRINGPVRLTHPRFLRTNLRLGDFGDDELYNIRITK